MKLKTLLKDMPELVVKGSKDVDISGICSHSKLAAPGNLFIARKGSKYDGNQFIEEAMRAGVSAILSEQIDPFLQNVTQIVHPNVIEMEGLLAARFYQQPGQQLFMVGITGTNGKTTTSYLVKHLLDSMKEPCGLIGTIEYILGENRHLATRTTPDAVVNQKYLREMVHNGCKAAIMEVTSHALAQQRISHIEFDCAIFTNLTQDHLDYHTTMENYCAAKALLFSSLQTARKNKHSPKAAIINKDDPWA